MYRLVLYYLTGLVLIAVALSLFGRLPYSPVAIVFSTLVLLLLCWAVNSFCAWLLQVEPNVESVYITAFILALIIAPPQGRLFATFPFLVWAAVWAMASKYIINFRNKHVFNPAALAVALPAMFLNMSANWWVGTAWMLPFVAIGGLLIVRKVQKFQLVSVFMAVTIFSSLVLTFSRVSPGNLIERIITDSPLVFFAAVMLTEPLTLPPTRAKQLWYAALVGWLFVPQVHVGGFYFTPELALLCGNAVAYLFSPKSRLVLKLKRKTQVGRGVYDFEFETNRPFQFRPGQYMEWTLGHEKPDARGNRRYFTLASSPTEKQVLLGVKFYPEPSSYKKKMLDLKHSDIITAGQLAGDFTLPKNQNEKLVFVAGGIGITPFRSMLKYLLDTNDKREIVVLYANRSEQEIVYRDILEQARQKLNIKTVYAVSGEAGGGWQGYRGHFTPEIIRKEIPDFAQRKFYISGSHVVVESFKKMLSDLGIRRSQIITDFFPGLA